MPLSSLCLHSLREKRIIQRYITLHPKLEASQELKRIMTRLKYSDESRFTKALDIWYIKYKSFLEERRTTCAKCTRQTERVNIDF